MVDIFNVIRLETGPLSHQHMYIFAVRMLGCGFCTGRFNHPRQISCRSLQVFTAQCYASAVLAMGLCLSVSVRLSQVGVLSKRLNESSWFLARELFSARPILR